MSQALLFCDEYLISKPYDLEKTGTQHYPPAKNINNSQAIEFIRHVLNERDTCIFSIDTEKFGTPMSADGREPH